MDNSKATKLYFAIIKWTIGLLLTVGFALLFWAIFYSSYFANLSFVIPLRIWYQESLWTVEKLAIKPVRRVPPFDPIYTIGVETPENGNYIYALWGTFVSADINTDIVKLKGFDGNVYTFLVGNNWKSIDNGSLSLPPAKPFDTVVANNHINVDTSPYTSQSIIVIRWDDKRTLYQIEKDYSADSSTPLNKNSTNLFSLSKYNEGK
ncbi:MAG TPA: hypothetical protein VKC54_01200 [Patescibacteria group bacterium]|nr:hypothetical protein [Patescibacteria group bacterium]